MRWSKFVVVGLAFILGGWMFFDGVHAFVTGDFVTPSEGDYAGQLGPWSGVVEAVGIPARSVAMRVVHVLLGAALMVSAVGFTARAQVGRRMLLVSAVAGLWYLPFGTVIGLVIVVLLLVSRSSAGGVRL